MNKPLAVFIAITLAGCVSHTINQGVSDPGPQVNVASIPNTERMTIGIARFNNESVYGSGLFTDASGDRIGKQAADLLARHLTATQRFNVVERQDLGKLETEAELMGINKDKFRQNLAGVEALILGSVVELGRDTTGGIWLIGKSKTQRARARVSLRLVDPKSGHVFYSQEGSGEAELSSNSTLGFGGTSGFDSTLEGKAIDAAIVNMINNITQTLSTRHSSSQSTR